MNEERESVGRGLKLLLKPFTESGVENPLIVKSDYCCPLENLAEDIQAQVKIHREFVNGLYEDCLAIPASCTSFRFTDLKGDLISGTGLLEKFGNLRVVYATAIVVASNSTEEWGNPGKTLLVFAEVGGIAVFPELGKVKLVTLRAEPNQWVSAGDHQNLQLSLPPSEQLFDLKSAEAQQLLIQEQSLVHVGNDPDLYLIPVHLNDESGRKLCANSKTCIPITFDPSECELVRVVNSTTVICQKLSERRIIHSVKEETLPPYVQKFCPNVFSLTAANSPIMASLAQHPADGNTTSVSDNESKRNESKLSPRTSSKSPWKNKRGRPKKEGNSKVAGSKEDVEMTSEEIDNIKGRGDKRKVKQRRMSSKPQDDRNTYKSKCAGGPNNKVKFHFNGNADSTDGNSGLENMKSVELQSITADGQDESLNEMSQAASNLLVLADAATIKIQQIDKENDRDVNQLEGLEAAALWELPEVSEKQNETNKSSRSAKRKWLLSSRKSEIITSPRLSEVNDNPPMGEITEKTDHLLIRET